MSRYFNKSQRQLVDRSLPAAPSKQADLNRVLEEVSQLGIANEVKVAPVLSSCRKLRVLVSSGQPLLLPKSSVPEQVIESYRTLRTRLIRIQADQKFRSVIMSSAMAREGKTLTSLNLALSCSRINNYRVLVIDADLRTRGLTHLLGEPAGPGLSEILAGKAEYEDAVMATDSPGLYVLGAGGHPGQASEIFAGTQWKEFMNWATGNFRLVIVDSPPILPVADFEEIVASCDAVLMVVRAYQTRRELLKKTGARIDPKKLIGIILNGVPASDAAEYEDAYSAAYTEPPAVGENLDQETAQVARQVGTVK
jgi:capsular exopolysaccharide synthesis family protein